MAAPNITPDKVSGIGAWSQDDLFRYLRRGNAPGRGQAGGRMAPIIEALQDSSDADLHALMDWLARQPPHRDPADTVPASERGDRLTTDPAVLRGAAGDSGAALYNGSCASCHGADGAGSRDGSFPSMFHNSSVGRRTPYNLVAALLSGVERHTRSGEVLMQSFDGEKEIVGALKDDELAALSNFVLAHFGDPVATVSSRDVERARLKWWGSGQPTAARGHLIAVGGGPGGAGSACFSCHGLEGQGDAGAGAGFPRLAGLDPAYLAKQMRDYASGARPNGAMSPIAQQLDPTDYQAVALYYAALPAKAPVRVSEPDSDLVREGATLYVQGLAERGIQACSSCHGPKGQGFNPVYPSIVQPAAYTDGQLRLWREGVRRNYPLDLMGSVSRQMTDADIRAAAAYLAGLAP